MAKSLLSLAPVYLLDFPIHNTDYHFERLKNEIPWRYVTSKTRGVYQMGHSYRYSGRIVYGEQFDPVVWKLMQRLNERLGLNLNSCLLNYYLNGTVGIARHSDDEKELVGGDQAVVVSLSLGATRIFRFHSKTTDERVDIPLKSGDVLVMGPLTQRYYEHSIPVQAKITEPRINLTFREFIDL